MILELASPFNKWFVYTGWYTHISASYSSSFALYMYVSLAIHINPLKSPECLVFGIGVVKTSSGRLLYKTAICKYFNLMVYLRELNKVNSKSTQTKCV